MSTASSQLLALLRRAQGDCSDKTLSELLEVNIGQVRRYADNKQQMSELVLERACRHAGEDLRAWQVKVLEDKTAPACTVSAFLIEQLRKKNNGCSDYKLSKILDVKATAIARWRDGDQAMSAERAMQVAQLAGLDPNLYVMRLQVERDINTPLGQVWAHFLGMVQDQADNAKDKVAALSGAAILALLSAMPNSADAGNYRPAALSDARPMYIMSSRRRSRTGRRATDRLPPITFPLPMFLTRVTPRSRSAA